MQKEMELNRALWNKTALKIEAFLCPFSGTKGWWMLVVCCPFAILSVSLEVLTPSSFNDFNTSEGVSLPTENRFLQWAIQHAQIKL